MIWPRDPHERSPNAPKFEDQSQEETEWQERCAREAAWRLAKSIRKLKVHERATFFSPSENRCLSMEKCRRMKRSQFMSKNWIFLDNESPRGYVSFIARKALRRTRILL